MVKALVRAEEKMVNRATVPAKVGSIGAPAPLLEY